MLSYSGDYGSSGGGSILTPSQLVTAIGNTAIANATHAVNSDHAVLADTATNADHATVANSVSALTSAQITSALGFTPGATGAVPLMTPNDIGSICIGMSVNGLIAAGSINNVYSYNVNYQVYLLPGSWKCLSYAGNWIDSNGNNEYAFLFQRIA